MTTSASAPPSHVYERQNTQGRSMSYTRSDPRSDPHQQHHNQHHPLHPPASAYWVNRDARYSGGNSVPPMGYRHRDFSSPDRLGGVVEGHHEDRHLYDRESRGGLRAGHGVSEGGGGGRGGGMGVHEDSRSVRGSGNGSGAPVSAGGLTREQELEIANEMERELKRNMGGQHSGGGDGGGSGRGSGRDDVTVVSGRGGPGIVRGAGIDATPAGGGGSGGRNLGSSGPPSSSVGSGDPGPMSSAIGSAPVREGGVPGRSSMGDEGGGDGSRRGSVDVVASAVGGGPGAGSVGGSQVGTRGLHPRSVPVPRTMGPIGSDGRGGAVGLGPNGSSSGGTGYRSQDPGGDSAQQHPSYWRGQPQDPVRQSHHPSSSHHHQQRRASSPSSAAAVAAAAPGGGYSGGAHAPQQQPGQHYRQHGHGQPPDRLGTGNSSNSGVGTGGVFYPGPPRGSGGGSGPVGVNGAPASGSSSGGGGGRVSHGEGLDGSWRVHGGVRGGDGSNSAGGGSQYPAPHGRETGDSRRCPPPPPPPTGVPNSQIQYRDATPSYPTYRASAASSTSSGAAIAVDDSSVGRRAVMDSSPMVAAASASVSAAPPVVAVAPSSTATASPSSVSTSHAGMAAVAMPDQQRSVAQRLPPSAAAGMSSAIAQLPHPPPRVLPREVDTGPSHVRQGPSVPAGSNSWGPGGVPSRGGVGASSASGPGSGPGPGPGPGPVPGMGGGVSGVSHQTPLEMLGAGLDGSYRVIQTAVPLGTRKVALQTLDDLALFFVDMRSTLLVRMASSADVMDELCLRTETFEKALGSPGGMVICAPQFLRPGGAMEEAGMLDGDLITHINGDSVSADPPEQLVWNGKPVKGVRLLDITFLRATGESSTVGYPWHEALAWWQSGVRRHMMESAQPEQRHWMHQASERRCRDAILSYRLFREYSMPTQRTSMSSASGVQGGSGGPPGNPPSGGVMVHGVSGGRHPAGPEPRGNNSGGTGSRTSGGPGAGAGTAGGMVNSARGSPAQSSGGADYSRERDRGMSANQRSASGGSGNGSVSGGGGIVNDRGSEAVDRSGSGIARSGASGGGGWRSRGNVSGSSSSWPAANSHPSASGGAAPSVGTEGISGDRVAPPAGTNRKTRGAWEDRDNWGGREVETRPRGRDYGRGRGTELERDDWAYHHQQHRQQWLDTRPGPKARSPLTVGGRGGNGSRGGGYPSEVDMEARGGGGSRDSYGGVIEGTGRGDIPESSPMEKDRRAGYGGASSPRSVKRGSRTNDEREGGDEDVRSGAVIDRSDERERRDATAVGLNRRRSGGDGGSSGEFGQKKHSRDGGGMGGSSGHSGDGPNYYEIDGDEDAEKRDSWDKNPMDSRFGGKGTVESSRRREMVQGSATSRDGTNDQGKDVVRDVGRSSEPSGSALPQQQLKNQWESSDGGRIEGYRKRRHEEGGGEGRGGVEGGEGRGGRSGKRVFPAGSPSRGGDATGDGDEGRSKRSKMDERDGDDYPVADGIARRRSAGGGGDVEMVSPTSRGLHENHDEQKQREGGSGFSRGGGRDGSDVMPRRWSDDGEMEGMRKDDGRGGKDDRWPTSSRSVMMTSSREGQGGDGVVSSPSVEPPTSSTRSGVGGRSRSRSKEGDSERQGVERGGVHQRRVGDRSTSPSGISMAVDIDGQGGTGGDWWGSMRQSCDHCAKKKIKCSGEADRCSRCRKEQIECIYSPKKKTGPIPRKASATGNDPDDSPSTSSLEVPRSRTRGRDGDENKERVVEEISENSRGEDGGGHGGAISRGVAKTFLEAYRRSSSRSPDSVRAWRDRRVSKNGSLYTGGRRWEDISRGSSRKGSESEREWPSRRGGGDSCQIDEPSTVTPQGMTRGVSPDSTHRIKHVVEEVPSRSRRDGDGKEQKLRGRGNSPESDVDGGGGLRGNRGRMKPSRSREDDDCESNSQTFPKKDNKGGASESSGSRRSSSVGVERETVPGGDDALKEPGSYPPSANVDARGSSAARDGGDSTDSRESKSARGFESEDKRSASGRRYRSSSGGPNRDEEGADGGRGENYPEETESNYPEEPERERRRRTGGKKSAAARSDGDDGSSTKWMTSGWEKPTGGGGSGVDEEADVEVGDKKRLSPEEKLTRAGFDVSTAPLPSTFLTQSSGREFKRGERGRSRVSPVRSAPSSVDAKSGRSSEDAGAGRENDKSRSLDRGDVGVPSRGGSSERRSKIASASGSAFTMSSSKGERDSEGSSADEVVGPRPSKRMCR